MSNEIKPGQIRRDSLSTYVVLAEGSTFGHWDCQRNGNGYTHRLPDVPGAMIRLDLVVADRIPPQPDLLARAEKAERERAQLVELILAVGDAGMVAKAHEILHGRSVDTRKEVLR